MPKIESFGETQNVAVTVLVDNRADLIVKSSDTVKYYTEEPLLAEHGFAALIDLKDANVRILWDAGITQIICIGTEFAHHPSFERSATELHSLSNALENATLGLLEFTADGFGFCSIGIQSGRPSPISHVSTSSAKVR